MKISQDEFRRFQIFLEQYSGILLSENKHYLVESRLEPLMLNYSLSSFSELLEQLDSIHNQALLKQVIQSMVTNESLWFRDDYPFEFLAKSICSYWPRHERFRILCVGCSSGQEPYSIAMALDSIGKLDNTEIVATDLSDLILEKARKGIYQKMEIERGLSSERVARYFHALDNNCWQINQKLKDKVSYRHVNLLDIPYQLGEFDIVFCRNVLIYFSEETKMKVLKALIAHINPQGYLFLGASESLCQKQLGMQILRCEPGFTYQKVN